MVGSKLIDILDRVSRPVDRRNSRGSRKLRLKALEFASNLSLSALIALAGFGFVAIMGLIFVPPPFWGQLDSIFRTEYWTLFNAKIDRFELALRSKEEAQVQAGSHMFFGLAGDLQMRDYGEVRYLRALEAALSSSTPAVRLRAAETGVALRPNDSLFWFHLGIERLNAGKSASGIEALQKSFRLRPYSRQIAAALIRAFDQAQDSNAILRVRTEYASGVSSVAGKMAPLHVTYVRPDGGIVGELQRVDACGPVDLALRNEPELKLNAIYFPQVDGLRVSVDAVTMRAIERLQNFRTAPEGGFISEIPADAPFTTTPGIIFKGSPPSSSLQIKFCAADGVEP